MPVAVDESYRTAHHAFGWYPVQRSGHRTHEITSAAGHDVTCEAVGLKIAEQLHHRRVAARHRGPAQRRMLGFGEERVDPAGVLLDGDLVMGLEYRSHKRFQVGVVTLVMLGDRIAQPLQVYGVSRLVRLLIAQ